jgi:fatty-acyl-CoA synthase
MKFAFSTLGNPEWSVEQTISAAKKFGYEGIEWRLLDGALINPVTDAEAVKQAVAAGRKQGIDTCALDTSCRFNLRAASDREAQVQDLLHWIALAQATQVPVLRIFGGPNQAGDGPEPSDEEVNGWVASGLRAAAPAAQRAGVSVALETHDAFSSARRTAAVLNTVDSPCIGALWDSHHPYRVGESPEEVFRLIGARLAHVHVKDAYRKAPGGNDWQLVLLGKGEVPVQGQMHTLKTHGYNGWVSVEWEKKWHPEIPAPEEAYPQHIALLREMVG